MSITYRRNVLRSFRRIGVLAIGICAFGVGAAPALAEVERAKDGFYHTGSATRTKAVGIVKLRLYGVRHDMRCLPEKSPAAVLKATCDRRLTLRFLRDMAGDKVREHLVSGLRKNGVTDLARYEGALAFLANDVREGKTIELLLKDEGKTLAVDTPAGTKVFAVSLEVGRMWWSVWFGVSDQEGLADALVSGL
jgi:hypothetical protein